VIVQMSKVTKFWMVMLVLVQVFVLSVAYAQKKDSTDTQRSKLLKRNPIVAPAGYEERLNGLQLKSQYAALDSKDQFINRVHWVNSLAAVSIALLLALIMTLYRISRRNKRVNTLLAQRVKERTRELDERFDEMVRQYSAQRIEVLGLSKEIQNTILSLRDLCHAHKNLVNENVQLHLEQLIAMLDHLSDTVRNIEFDNE